MLDDELLIKILKKTKTVMVFTGAGISAESGIPTFRGKNGLWEKFDVEKLATPEGFMSNPVEAWQWYEFRRQEIAKSRPNAAHIAVAQLESIYTDFQVVTQNIDGYHRVAGNKNIVELHGNIWNVKCVSCNYKGELLEVPLKTLPPKCSCGSLLRPDVVLFGEPLPQYEWLKAVSFASKTEVMFIIGTSAVVYPAAYLPIIAKQHGSILLEFNLEATPLTDIVDRSFFGVAGKTLPAIVQNLMR